MRDKEAEAADATGNFEPFRRASPERLGSFASYTPHVTFLKPDIRNHASGASVLWVCVYR
jgi:hypothetical protein